MTQVATVTINYNAGDLALQAVESILETDHGGLDVEVHLIDNASPNGDGDMLAAEIVKRGWTDKIVYHQETTNHGFGRGNNLVLNQVWNRENKPEYVFFLNPDAALKTAVFSELVTFLDENPTVAMAGCGIDRPDVDGPVTSAFRFPSAASEFAAAISFGPISRLFDAKKVAFPPDIPTQRVDWVAGAAVMGRLSALQDVGFFDPDYFLYFEEADMINALARAGWETWHVAHARVEHVAGASTGLRENKSREGNLPPYWYDSWQMYFVKNHGRGYALLAAFAKYSGWAMNVVLRAMMLQRPRGPAGFGGDFLKYSVRPILRRRMS